MLTRWSCLLDNPGRPQLGSPSPKPEAFITYFPMRPHTQVGRLSSPEPEKALSGGRAQGQPISSPKSGLVGLTHLSVALQK